MRAALNIRFRSEDQPTTLFVDRGQGFYNARGGQITKDFKEALAQNSLEAYYPDNASAQPGNLQEVMLHETAVSWIRRQESITRSTEPWKETVPEFAKRMRAIPQDVNANLNVEGLCRAFPKRLQLPVDAEGDRIRP